MTQAQTARVFTGEAASPLHRRGVPSAWPMAWAAICLAAFAVGWLLLVPHQPTGGLELGRLDPTAGLAAFDLGRIEVYETWYRPFELATICMPVIALLLLGLTPAGAHLTGGIGAGLRLPSLRALCIAFAVVGIAWVVSLPAHAGVEVVSQSAGAVSGGWQAWAVDRFVQLVQWWAIAAVAVLAVRLSARLLRRSWWMVLTLVAFALVLAGTVLSGHLTFTEPNYPSLPEGPLRSDVLDIADDIGVGISDVQVVPQSPTTTTYNAFVTGIGDDHVVVLYETFLLYSNRDEVNVVAAHELGHVEAHDSERRALLAGLAAALITALVGAAATSQLVRRKARTQDLRISDAPAVPMLIALTVAACVLVLPVLDGASRAIELRADFTALQATHDPEALKAVVARSALLYLDEPNPAWGWRMLSGHPAPVERIALAEAWAARAG